MKRHIWARVALSILILSPSGSLAMTVNGTCDDYFYKNNLNHTRVSATVDLYRSGPGSSMLNICRDISYRAYPGQVYADSGSQCGDVVFANIGTTGISIIDKNGTAFALNSSLDGNNVVSCSIEGAKAITTEKSRSSYYIQSSSLRVYQLLLRTTIDTIKTPSF